MNDKTDKTEESFSDRCFRLADAIQKAIDTDDDVADEQVLQQICCGISALFLSLQASSYALMKCGIITKSASTQIDEALGLVEAAFRAAVADPITAKAESLDKLDPESATEH